ncbi:RNA polymerase factor sigma-54 [Rurimicrobium arvi]|uniref:RNA polymerase factor sigma-54 n=1 Tax=Rurimicrobium arvi TaxID=2049916 RepID=A0ABP8MKH5_9BACT
MLRQSQQQKLLQKMSPQLIQFLKLLRVPTIEMEQRIKEEMEINPALVYESDAATSSSSENIFEDDNRSEDSGEDFQEEVSLQDDHADQVDIDDYLRSENDDGGYAYNNENDKNPYSYLKNDVDFHESLLEQMQMLSLSEKEEKIAEQIIGSINDDGYLSRSITAIVDDLAFSQNVSTTEEEVKSIIQRIQQFDPPGIAAYTLQECLIIQLKRIGKPRETIAIAISMLEKHYEAFVKKHFDRIKRSLHINDVQFREAMDMILKLNPKPGAAFENPTAVNKTYIIPDFFVDNNDGKIEVMLNSKNAPELRISPDFREMLNDFGRTDKKDKKNAEAITFIKQKLESAQWFINSIKQRQATLLQTMNTIVDLQKDFFLTGDETTLKPMILKDVAELTNLDISTVSRVANSKYVQTQFGTYSLKHFFSEKITLDSGKEVTNKEIKSILAEIIEGEDKDHPLRDEDLTDILLKKGYNISRRTVAKYREQLMIPVARLRKS